MSGNQIGPYRLGKTLGVGSFSKVKIAIHETTQQKVAIKILNRQKLKSMDMAIKVAREIKILRLFSHPHIIRLYEVIDTPTDIFVVMEYVPNGELFEYIVSRGRLSEDEARKFFQQIVCGLEYCHTNLVVHRDLKPENLLLDLDSNVKLADFGLSNLMRDGHFLSTSCGSPNYAAPEVISGNLYAGPEVDVWSCGVILYALLCGSLPFDDDNIANLFRKIKSGTYAMPSYLSDSARDLLPKLLVVDPMKRATIASIRKHPWFIKNLPQYLSVHPEPSPLLPSAPVDESIIAEMTSMGFDQEKVIAALAMGPDLLTESKFATHTDARRLAVAYLLLLDKKRRNEQDFNPTNNLLLDDIKKTFVPTASSPFKSPMRTPTLKSATDSPRLLSQNNVLGAAQREKAVTRRWFVGIWTACDPATIMNDLFRALKYCQFEWKILSPYKLKIRRVFTKIGSRALSSSIDSLDGNVNDKIVDTIDNQVIIKMGLQLYKTPRNRYVLDVQKLFGETFIFMNLCSQLMTELRI